MSVYRMGRSALVAASLFSAGVAFVLMQGHPIARAEPVAVAAAAPEAGSLATAIFANGCFWCSESDFEKLDGVVSAVSGYTGGTTPNPTYEVVGQGGSGHAEAVEVKYDPAKISYASLVDFYFRHTDVLDGGGQFCDRGDQYRPAIFVRGQQQKDVAASALAKLQTSGRFKQPIAVEINDAATFTIAEDYHQDYYKKSAIKYNFYRKGCGRDARLKSLWGSDYAH
jgi:methionine-S-sulfoxide reductase